MKPERVSAKKAEQTDGEKLLTTQQEIHELILQLALGKAEALDRFEEIKRNFARQIREIKESLRQPEDATISPEIWVKLDDLEVQLSIGEAKSKSLFEEQKIIILHSLVAFEGEVINYFKSHNFLREFVHEAEKFKLKLEVLKLRFVLEKFKLTEEYESLMSEARSKIGILTSKRKEVKKVEHEVLDDIKSEISVAYKHIRKAILSLK